MSNVKQKSPIKETIFCKKDLYISTTLVRICVPTLNSTYAPIYIRLIYSYTPIVHEMVWNTNVKPDIHVFIHTYNTYACKYDVKTHMLTDLVRICVYVHTHPHTSYTHTYILTNVYSSIFTARLPECMQWRRICWQLLLRVFVHTYIKHSYVHISIHTYMPTYIYSHIPTVRMYVRNTHTYTYDIPTWMLYMHIYMFRFINSYIPTIRMHVRKSHKYTYVHILIPAYNYMRVCVQWRRTPW